MPNHADVSRHTMCTLLSGIEHKTHPTNLAVLRGALLRSAFNHLFSAQLAYGIDERFDVGLAMSTLLVLAGDRT